MAVMKCKGDKKPKHWWCHHCVGKPGKNAKFGIVTTWDRTGRGSHTCTETGGTRSVGRNGLLNGCTGNHDGPCVIPISVAIEKGLADPTAMELLETFWSEKLLSTAPKKLQ